MKMKKIFKNKSLRYGSIATAITAGFIAIVVLFNVVLGLALDRFPVQIDLTSNKEFELSQTSIDFAKTIDTKVTINVLLDKNEFLDSSYSDFKYNTQVYQIMKKYASASNNKVEISFVDILKTPNFASKYPDLNLAAGGILISSELRNKYLELNQLFNVEQDPQTGQNVITTSIAENVLTGAIFSVIDKDPLILGFTSGHGESGADTFQKNLNLIGYTNNTLDLSIDEIDKNAKILVISAPASDFSESELDKIDKFLINDNKYGKNLVVFANPEKVELPALEAFLAEWGIKINKGIVMETNNELVYESPFNIINYLTDSELKATLKNPDFPVMTPFIHPIEALFEKNKGYTTSVVLTTTDSSVLLPEDATNDFNPNNEKQQAFNSIIKSEFLRDDEGKNLKSSVYVFGGTGFIDEKMLNTPSLNNAEYLNSFFNAITEKKSKFTIAPKNITTPTLGMSNSAITFYFILFVIIIPLGVLVAGIVIWLRRRNK
jgi:ABC-2 type transport system permease protein